MLVDPRKRRGLTEPLRHLLVVDSGGQQAIGSVETVKLQPVGDECACIHGPERREEERSVRALQTRALVLRGETATEEDTVERLREDRYEGQNNEMR